MVHREYLQFIDIRLKQTQITVSASNKKHSGSMIACEKQRKSQIRLREKNPASVLAVFFPIFQSNLK